MVDRNKARRAQIASRTYTAIGVYTLVFALAMVTLPAVLVFPGAGMPHFPLAQLIGMLVAVVALCLIAFNEREIYLMLRDIVHKYKDTPVPPCPSPWIHESIWHRQNRFQGMSDAVSLMNAICNPLEPHFGQDAHGAFRHIKLRPVSDDERAAAPKRNAQQPAGAPIAPDVALTDLLATPGRLIALGVDWPYCCHRPARLVGTRGLVDGGQEALVLLPIVTEAQDDSASNPVIDPDPANTFICSICAGCFRTSALW